MYLEKGMKVKLTVDLTKYASGLVAGTEGVTVGRRGMWSRGNDRFITVCFPGITTLDVLWDSLEVIDQEALEAIAREKELFLKHLKGAEDVTLYVGPKGGFRALSYCYTDPESGVSVHTSEGFRDEAYRIMDLLKEYGIPITTKTIK